MSPEDIQFIWDRQQAGLPAHQIAKQIGRPILDVMKWMTSRDERRARLTGDGEDEVVVLSLWRGLIRMRPRPQTMREVADEVCEQYGLSFSELIGPQRARYVSHPRQELMWRLYASGRFTLPQIGKFLGDRDHTTILHGVKACEARMAADLAA